MACRWPPDTLQQPKLGESQGPPPLTPGTASPPAQTAQPAGWRSLPTAGTAPSSAATRSHPDPGTLFWKYTPWEQSMRGQKIRSTLYSRGKLASPQRPSSREIIKQTMGCAERSHQEEVSVVTTSRLLREAGVGAGQLPPEGRTERSGAQCTLPWAAGAGRQPSPPVQEPAPHQVQPSSTFSCTRVGRGTAGKGDRVVCPCSLCSTSGEPRTCTPPRAWGLWQPRPALRAALLACSRCHPPAHLCPLERHPEPHLCHAGSGWPTPAGRSS